jgi:hypothetical protein
MRLIFCVSFLLVSTAIAHAKDMSAFDLLIDGKSLDGQQVTVKDCTVIGAMASIVMCNVQTRGNSVGNLIIDGDTMERPSLRRALSQCSDMRPMAACKVASLTGKVRINRSGDLRLDNASVSWARP